MSPEKTEIERKFLVDVERLPAVLRTGGAKLAQGYLSFTPSVRVRVAEETGASRAWLTIKGPGTIERTELEYPIPVEDAHVMLAMCAASLSKIRRHTKVGSHVWDVDELLGSLAPLWLAEVELRSAGEPFERPDWLGDEVTEDSRYTNAALARAGRPP
jgi:adenylate cyclase